MARVIADLHPGDFTARDHIRWQLREIRRRGGITQRELGDRLGVDQSNIRRLERAGVLQSRTSSVVRWARALGHELKLEPALLPAPIPLRRPSRSRDADEMLAILVHSAGLAGDDWRAARLVADLTGIRIAAGVTQQRLADRLGLSLQAISYLEASTVDNAIVVLQRYARGVAQCSRWRHGRLEVWLEPIVSNPQPTVDSCSVDTPELVPST